MPPQLKLIVALLVSAPLGEALAAYSEELAFKPMLREPGGINILSTAGPSGMLTVPDGQVLDDGVVVFGLNNAIEPQFSRFQRDKNYQFGIGFLPYMELSGRLANYPNQQGGLGVRDLSANVKISIPRIFKYQPEIALGINDLGGGLSHFKSKYIAVSNTFGPLRLSGGVSRGEPYLGKLFGGAELVLWNTGASVFVERNSHAYVVGGRYATVPIPQLWNGQFVVNAQRSFKALAPDGGKFDRTALGVYLTVPFGKTDRNPHKVTGQDEPIWTPPPPGRPGTAAAAGVDRFAPLWTPPGEEIKVVPPLPPVQRALVAPGEQLQVGLDAESLHKLEQIAARLEKVGLERVRVGLRRDELVIEYENHRYNQNEVDAIGIVLGLGVSLAPDGVERVSVVTKKSGLALYQTRVDWHVYRDFLRDGESNVVRSALVFQYRPGSGDDVQWLDNKEGPRGYSRVRIDPQLIKFVGTEVGVFDYSLSANIQMFVPLWKGAEAGASYIRTLAESDDVKYGFLGYAQQPSKLKSATLSQAFWVTDRMLNVTTAGKFNYNATGAQNETTWFLPYRDDQVRLQATRTHHTDFYGLRVDTRAASASYLWSYQPLGLTAELAYNRYQSKDKGPSFQIGRWFGDVQAQAYLRTSGADKKIGFSLAFPLTPRQGMLPGWTHLEGSSSFPFKLETRLASKGECNCITNGVVEELPMVYSARGNLLNHARTGKDYLVSQLQRMREAALVYASVVP